MNHFLKYSFSFFCLLACSACDDDGIDILDIEIPEGYALSAGTSTIFLNSSVAYDTPADWITGAYDVRFTRGDRLYDDVRTSNNGHGGGLGPVYAGYSCGSCHRNAGRTKPSLWTEGGSGSYGFSSMLVYISRKNGAFFQDYGRVLHDQAIYGVQPEGKLSVEYTYETFSFPDGEAYTLCKPNYTISEWYAEEIKPEEIKKEFKKEFRKDRKDFGGHKERKEYKKDSKKDFKKEPKKEFVKENKTETVSAVTAAAPVQEEKKELHVAVVTEETQKICEKFLQEVLQAMGMGEVNIVSSIDEEGALAIEMNGENMGILIGKRGQTLDSLQYLTNRVANKSQDGYVRVKLDTEDYRKRRKQTLENLAKNIAYKVKRSRKPISLEPMNPYERRIIHSALQADDRVSTHSEGEEPYRRVVVTPNRR